MPTRLTDKLVATQQTTNATAVFVARYTVPQNSIGVLSAGVMARTVGGVRATFSVYGSAGRELSTATLISLALDILSPRRDAGAASWLAAVDVDGNDLAVRLTGQLSTTIDWVVFADVLVYTP